MVILIKIIQNPESLIETFRYVVKLKNSGYDSQSIEDIGKSGI